MAKSPKTQPSLFAVAPFAFADRFLQDHAGQIISEPRTAILELIANSYDAGATQIDIVWPTEKGEKLSVTDNGIGMTKAEFEKRWKTLCYDRVPESLRLGLARMDMIEGALKGLWGVMVRL